MYYDLEEGEEPPYEHQDTDKDRMWIQRLLHDSLYSVDIEDLKRWMKNVRHFRRKQKEYIRKRLLKEDPCKCVYYFHFFSKKCLL